MGEKNLSIYDHFTDAAGGVSSFLILKTDRFSPPTLNFFWGVAHATEIRMTIKKIIINLTTLHLIFIKDPQAKLTSNLTILIF